MRGLSDIIKACDAYFSAHNYEPTNSEEIECISDCQRAEESLDLVDHWVMRCGLPDDLFAELVEWIEYNEIVTDEKRNTGRR